MVAIAPERAEVGYALHEDEGEAFWLLGMLQTIKISRQDTGGAYGLLEVVVPEGLGSPWHVHPEEDEWVFSLDSHSPQDAEPGWKPGRAAGAVA